MEERPQTPAFYGLALLDDKEWGFNFWYPDNWHRLEFADGRSGVILAPVADDASTSFSIEVRNLGTKVGKNDVKALYEGFMEGLAALPDFHLEWQDKWVVAQLVGLEAKYTFSENGATRKRWIRLLYEGKRQFHAVAQGSSVDEYAYWEPMLFECMATLRIM